MLAGSELGREEVRWGGLGVGAGAGDVRDGLPSDDVVDGEVEGGILARWEGDLESYVWLR